MKINCLFFAQLREWIGADNQSLEVSPETAGQEFKELLQNQWKLPEDFLASCRVAVNGHFVKDDEIFRDGDEIALIPPVSGG